MTKTKKVLEEFENHPAWKEDLQLRTNGLTRKEVADQRHVSTETVRTQFEDIHKALGAYDDTEAVVKGLQYGLTVLPELTE
jgi:DNA-binding NarL/FixJ family response regulator